MLTGFARPCLPPVFRLPRATVRASCREEFRAFTRLSVEVEKDGVPVALPMSAFLKDGVDDEVLAVKDGDVADLYFSFPQEMGFEDEYGDREYQLELVDLVRAR